jgi:hypothetical protein
MLASAEVRWFWRDDCPEQARKWFFETGLPPGGGHPRIDRYLAQPNARELGIKERGGDKPSLEFKGLLKTATIPAVDTLASHCEIWCKWSFGNQGVQLIEETKTTKRRWLRKFDTSTPIRAEVPLDFDERPKFGYSLPNQGCNAELTEVKIENRSDIWWTLGFEAFGDLETVPTNLTRGLLPDATALINIVSSGALLSYPEWLMARLAD